MYDFAIYHDHKESKVNVFKMKELIDSLGLFFRTAKFPLKL